MMVPKTYSDPGSETLGRSRARVSVAALAAGSVGAIEPTLLLYPVYYCLVNGRARAPDRPPTRVLSPARSLVAA